ncbi:MAG: alpha/beta hydrolase fold, partial [Candidatus Solibacter sp.]|nr:alpha/beta hydrolase fold [Candidatus Solibacter sp.]
MEPDIYPDVRRYALLLLTFGLSCNRSHTAAVESKPHPCSLDGIPDEARCATYTAWENRETQAGRRIPLNVVILPPLASPRAPDPLIILADGPGQTATDLIGLVVKNRELRVRRDIIFIGQRGTG